MSDAAKELISRFASAGTIMGHRGWAVTWFKQFLPRHWNRLSYVLLNCPFSGKF